jgi:hypothetical protein
MIPITHSGLFDTRPATCHVCGEKATFWLYHQDILFNPIDGSERSLLVGKEALCSVHGAGRSARINFVYAPPLG